jgi:hypothetical protein
VNSIKSRIAKLEPRSAPQRQYVYRVSNPITPDEAEAIEVAKREGRRIIVAPHPVASPDEWQAKYSPFGNL